MIESNFELVLHLLVLQPLCDTTDINAKVKVLLSLSSLWLLTLPPEAKTAPLCIA